jgi:lipopolysaccharide export system protein LptA
VQTQRTFKNFRIFSTVAFLLIGFGFQAIGAPLSGEEQRRRDLFLRSQQSPAKTKAPTVRRTAPAPAKKTRPPQPKPSATPSPTRQSYGYRGTAPLAQPVRPPQVQPQRPPAAKPIANPRPPVRSTPPRQKTPPPAPRPPRPPNTDSKSVDLSTLRPAENTEPVVVRKKRTRIIDHIRMAAQGARQKLESLPRTDQSIAVASNDKVPPARQPVKRNPDPATTSSAIAKVNPRRSVGPTSADLKRQPAVVKVNPKPVKAAPPKRTVPKLDPDPSAIASSPNKTKPAKASEPTLPPAPDESPELELALTMPTKFVASESLPVPPLPQTGFPAPPEDSYEAIAGNSIFRSLAILASTTAMRAGSEALQTEIAALPSPSAGDPSPSPAPAAGAKTSPPAVDSEKAEFVAFKNLAESKIPKLAARVASGGKGLGLSVDDVLDLTKSDDDLPFIKHEPPSASSGAGTGDLVISAVNQTDFDIASSEMEFSGNVQVKSPRFAMRCDRFIVHLKADGSGMDYGEGVGNVFIRMQNDGKASGHEGFADRAIYRPQQGKLTLSGWPKIRESHKEHVAATRDTQMVLYTDGRVKTLGRNRTVIRN